MKFPIPKNSIPKAAAPAEGIACNPSGAEFPPIVVNEGAIRHVVRKHPKVVLKEAYARLLDRYPWQWFCSLTFDHSKHPESAIKSFKFWIKHINRKIYGCRAQKRNQSIFWMLAIEPHKSGNIHLHALLGDFIDLNESCSRKWAHDLWYKQNGLNHIDRITDNSDRVTKYVCKYITKGGDIYFCEHLEQFKTVQLSGLAK